MALLARGKLMYLVWAYCESFTLTQWSTVRRSVRGGKETERSGGRDARGRILAFLSKNTTIHLQLATHTFEAYKHRSITALLHGTIPNLKRSCASWPSDKPDSDGVR